MIASKSQRFLFILIAFLAGVLTASFLILPYELGNILKFVSGFTAIGGIIVMTLWRPNPYSFVGILILVFAFGVFWYQRNIDFDLLQINNLSGKIISDGRVRGIIIDEPEFKNDRANYILKTDDKLKILIQTMHYPEYEYGDKISAEGKIEEPKNFDNNFDYKSYLVKDDIYLMAKNPKITLLSKSEGYLIYEYLYKFKNKLENVFKNNLPEPQASLLAGITLGSRSGLPKDVLDDFSRTGTSHIVALSGYNISAIALFVMSILGYFMLSRNISFWVSLLVIGIFVLMTGASASVVRAAVMGILALIASQQGRLYTAKNALIFAGAVMVFLNPKILRFDVGFQLSFMAVLGLILISPWLEEKLKNLPEILGIKKALIATLSAQIFVLPLIFYYFGAISWLSPLVNILILPAVPMAMLLGFAGAFSSLIFAPLAKIFLWPAWLFLSWILEAVRVF